MKVSDQFSRHDSRMEILLFDVLYDFLGTVKAAPHECVIRIGQP